MGLQMKNAAIVLAREENPAEAAGANACINAFRAGGYSFFEIRYLYDADAERAVETIATLKEVSENLVVIARKEALLPLINVVSDRWKMPFTQGTLSGAGVFTQENFSLFLLSLSDAESGADYVKNACIPYLNRKYSTRYDRMVLRFVGVEEARVQALIASAERMSGDRLSYRYGETHEDGRLEISYDVRAPKMLIDDVLRLFVEGLDDSVYALDDTPVEVQLVRLLKLRGKKISVAESFTGGGLSKRIVSVAGASEAYFEGVNTYAEKAKQTRLGVSAYTLNTFGAVSDSTAYEMAAGLIATGNCDVAIATTGLAGPKSDRSELPVGLCFVAVGTKEKIFVYRYKFDGTREEITEKAITYALFNACKHLKNM